MNKAELEATTWDRRQVRDNVQLVPSAGKPPTDSERSRTSNWSHAWENSNWPQVWENLRVPSARKPPTGSECGKTSNGSQARKSPMTFRQGQFRHLGWEKHCESKVSCPHAQHIDSGQHSKPDRAIQNPMPCTPRNSRNDFALRLMTVRNKE